MFIATYTIKRLFIFGYAFADELPELSGIEKAIFTIIKPQIDANNKRYENGRKGGRPPKKTETTEEENKNHRLLKEETIGFDNRKPNVNDNVNVTENDNGNVKDISCAEPETDSAPPVIELILNDKTFYPIYQTDIGEWSECFPGVDVMQELRKMKSWSHDNPTRRKTRRGIRRFISSWLSREQDKGGAKNSGTNTTGASTNDYSMSYQAWE